MSDKTKTTTEGIRISEMVPLQDVNGEVWFEVSYKAASTQNYRTHRLSLEQMLQLFTGSASLTVEELQELLNKQGYTVHNSLRVLGENSAVVANAHHANFLFLFDKRLGNENTLSASATAPQYMGEMGRMEEEGYSYWKNTPAVSRAPQRPTLPDSEIRLYDDGRVQMGGLSSYIEFSAGDVIRVVKDSEETEYDLTQLTKSAFDKAQEYGFEGTEEEWYELISKPSFFDQARTYGWEGTEEELFAHLFAEPVAGVTSCVFITDVTPVSPADNVGNKVKTEEGHTLLSCYSSTQHVKVTVEAITGPSSFTPKVRLNDLVDVPMTLLEPNGTRFRGTVQIDLEQLGGAPYTLHAKHGDGGEAMATVIMETPPVITLATFTETYKNGQTELKAGDEVGVRFISDVPVVGYEIANLNALTASAGDLPQGTEHLIDNVVIANRGNTVTEQGFRVRVRTATGTWSQWFDSNSVDSKEDGVSFVRLNNLAPTITFTNVTYPGVQGALAAGQSATVNHTVSDADEVAYSSENGQLTIASPGIYEQAKIVDHLDGAYNLTTNNFTVTATRAANGAVTTRSTVVKIATELPVISITTPASRLRSGGSLGTEAQSHTITLNSTVELLESPLLNAPSGNWGGEWTPNAARTRWTRTLIVHDADDKGVFEFTGLQATSLAGRTQDTINAGASYTIGGFVQRRMQVAPYPNRQAAIGTEVTDTSKLRCSNLSKGPVGSLNFQYKDSMESEVGRYTIIEGNIWYNLDDPNATSNTSGAMYIDLEELA